ncbi:hypothetical protein [Sinorhizobium meliloti]|uniref:hypothetical protein n=1 Tax=Rhizobium meliloti TaxID=382 RepID=UPI001AEFF04D|nr:hypothetical protein [Sinorhizobium meliloti]
MKRILSCITKSEITIQIQRFRLTLRGPVAFPAIIIIGYILAQEQVITTLREFTFGLV